MHSALSIVILLIAAAIPTQAVLSEDAAAHKENPVRHVITMLQQMHGKLEADVEKRSKDYEDFMCFCKHMGIEQHETLDWEKDKIPETKNELDRDKNKKKNLDGEIDGNEKDKEKAEEQMNEGEGIHNKTEGLYLKESLRLDINLKALKKAIFYIERGMGKSFLQETNQASQVAVLKRIADDKEIFEHLDEKNPSDQADSHDTFISFLEGGNDSPQGEEILGVLKQMVEEMEEDLKETLAKEAAEKKAFELLMDTSKTTIKNLGKAINLELLHRGALMLGIVEEKSQYERLLEAYKKDKESMDALKAECKAKFKHHQVEMKRSQEAMQSITNALEVLEDDDSLELFKKTFKRSASASFIQLQMTEKKALKVIRETASKHKGSMLTGFISLALHGKRKGFEMILYEVGKMIRSLEAEQKADDEKMAKCQADDAAYSARMNARLVERNQSDAALAAKQDEIDALEAEKLRLETEIQKLMDEMANRTAMYEKFKEDSNEEQADRRASVRILEVAENKLRKFYSPKLWTPSKETIEVALTEFSHEGTDATQSHSHDDRPMADFRKHETRQDLYALVVKYMQDLINELNQDITDEDGNRADELRSYNRAIDRCQFLKGRHEENLHKTQESLNTAEDDLVELKSDRQALNRQIATLEKLIAKMKANCDWLVENHAVRKRARDSEKQSLANAEMVLKGADPALYGHEIEDAAAFLQPKSRRGFLKHH